MGLLTGLLNLFHDPGPVVTLTGSVPSAKRLNYALELDKAGRIDDAAAIYWAMVEADPGEVGAAINLADIWIRQNRPADAEILMSVMTDKFPDCSPAWCNLSSARSAMGDPDGALVAANEAVKADVHNANAYHNRAECWWAVNQHTLAIRDFERAVTLDPTNTEICDALELHKLALTETKQPFGNVKHEMKAHGAWMVDGIEVASTLQCPHCDAHFVSLRDSRVERLWCSHCSAVTCGKPECNVCIPYMRKLEILEKSTLTG